MRTIATRLLVTLCALMIVPGVSVSQTRPITFPPQPDQAVPGSTIGRSAKDPGRVSGLKTSVEFQILNGNPAAALDAQRWVEALQGHGVTVRVRTPKAGDELGVTETVRGTLRWVVAAGELDVRGTLRFPDRSFSITDANQLEEWINELKLYGAQGAPEGKPLWGLTYDQFDRVFRNLSEGVSVSTTGMTLDTAIDELPLPDEMPVRFHSTAHAHLSRMQTVDPLRVEVRGMSCGSALAAVLAGYGLGYRPLRTPEGEMELVVEPLASLRQPWPIGWEPEKETSRGKLAPGLFKMVPVGFDDVPLEDILSAVAEVASIPVVVNYSAAAGKGIDIAQTRVSYPKKRAAYMMVLSSVVRRSRLTQDLRVDERGAAFVYVTAFVPRTVEDLSPAESD